MDFSVGDVVAPVNAEGGTEIALVETSEESEMIAVGNPELRAI